MDASSFDEAAQNCKAGAWPISGGTDLLGTLKDEILREYPTVVVNLKTIQDADYIKADGDVVRIGALAKLKDVAADDTINTQFACLAQAAGRAASPTIRSMGTIGGNICQQHRCWYFRCADNRFDCHRKGGTYCPAFLGDTRYHSIFGNSDGCYAVSSSETAPALMALGATIVTTNRSIAADDFFGANVTRSNMLEDGELVKEITIPNKQYKSAFTKFALRKAIDFALVSCAIAVDPDTGTPGVVLGAVYPKPWRSQPAQDALANGFNDTSAAAAGDAAVSEATALKDNEYKIEIARTVVKRTAQAVAAL
jgi:xanthine dehydrogenase YagS FAD-binding subunit